MTKSILRTAAISGAIAVALGALGAHALKVRLSPEALSSFETAVRYQFWHSLALLALAALQDKLTGVRAIFYLWSLGILLFSGSIYALVLAPLASANLSFLGPVTPLGGLALITGWVVLAISRILPEKPFGRGEN